MASGAVSPKVLSCSALILLLTSAAALLPSRANGLPSRMLVDWGGGVGVDVPEDPAQPGRPSVMAHEAEAKKACSLVLKSEEKLKNPDEAPVSLVDAVAQGRWGYRQTSAGVLKHPLLTSDSGNFDLWVETAWSGEGGKGLSEISSLVYLTSHAETTEGFIGSLTIKGEGYYDKESGLLCMVGCVEGDSTPSYWGGLLPGTASEGADAPYPDVIAGEDPLPAQQDWAKAQTATEKGKGLCNLRMVFRYRHDPSKSGQEQPAEVTGHIESLYASGKKGFFSPLVITGNTGIVGNQIWLFQLEMLTEAAFLLLQAVSLAFQIVHTRREVDGIYVSQTLVSVQFLVFSYYWIRSAYYPLRYMSTEIIMYLLSDLANAPRVVEFLVCLLCLAWGVSVDSKRRTTSRFKGTSTADGVDVEALTLLPGASSAPAQRSRLSEKPFALGFWVVYLSMATVLWHTYGIENMLRVSQFMFLVPQICLNYFWDLPKSSLGAITPIYAVVTSVTQMIWLTYESVRPHVMGYDEFYAFPHAWYWSSMFLMTAQLAAFIYQRVKGSRFGIRKPIVESLQATSKEDAHGV